MILSGNEAIVEGALKAGAKYFAGYPITPSSEIMHTWAKIIPQKNDNSYTFLQTEDEISAIHSVIGASLAAKKSFTTTSGPGFSLMQEGIGLAYAYKIPLVLINVQRQGPSTGMPTLFSQGDIMQTQYGTHGDHISITFYPNSIQECFDLTIQAFNAACESSSPVTILSDALLAHMYENIDTYYQGKISNYPFLGVGNENRHFTGLTTNKEGNPDTDNPESCKRWIKKIQDSILKTAEKYELYEYIENKNSDTLVISFGILSRVVMEWQDEFAIFRPIRLFPVLEDKLKEISTQYKKIVVVEANFGQYTKEIERVLRRDIELVSVQGGKVNVEEIYNQIKK